MNKKIAIIGSGPAGMAASQQLARVGHEVHLYEKNKKFYELKNDGKAMLDLQSVLLNQILSYGVFVSNVLIDKECTKCSYKKFFSYRREKEKSGRMLSIFNLMLK